MRALVYTEDFELDMLELEIPRPGADEVLVRVAAAGICGSDVHGVMSRSPRRQPPLVMGHELVGDVVESGGSLGERLVGQVVAVNPQVPCARCNNCRAGRENLCQQRELIGGTRPGGFGEYVAVPERCAHVISDLEPARAVFAEPLATCVHALSESSTPIAGTAVVVGAGTIGVLAAQLLRRLGTQTVVISEANRYRRHLAVDVADLVVSPDDLLSSVADLTSGEGVTLTVDAVGTEASRRQSLDVLSAGGTSVWLGMHEHEGPIDGFDVVARELRIEGSFAYTNPEFATAVRLLADDHFELAVSHTSVSLEASSGVFRSMIGGEAQQSLKSIVRPGWQSDPVREAAASASVSQPGR